MSCQRNTIINEAMWSDSVWDVVTVRAVSLTESSIPSAMDLWACCEMILSVFTDMGRHVHCACPQFWLESWTA